MVIETKPNSDNAEIFLDWCPTKNADIGKNGSVVTLAKNRDLEYIVARVFAKFNRKIEFIDCVGRSDGLIFVILVFNQDDRLNRPVRIERYILRKLKERLLEHSHIFHNTVLAEESSHDPVKIDINSVNFLAKEILKLDTDWVSSYLSNRNNDTQHSIIDLFSNNSFIANLVSKEGIRSKSSEYFAVDLLLEFLIGRTFEARQDVGAIIAERKSNSKYVQSERKHALIVIMLLTFLLFVISSIFQINYLYSIVSGFSITFSYTMHHEQENLGRGLLGARKVCHNAIGYALSAEYFSGIYKYIISDLEFDTCKTNIRPGIKEINSGKIKYSLESLHILLENLNNRMQARQSKLTILLTGFGVLAAIITLAMGIDSFYKSAQ